MTKEASVYFDNGVLVVDFLKNDKLYKEAYVDYFRIRKHDLILNIRKRNFLYVDHGNDLYAQLRSDVDAYDQSYIDRALPQYVEFEGGYWKKKGLFKKKKFIPAKKRLKKGWVELQPSESKVIISSVYRIIM